MSTDIRQRLVDDYLHRLHVALRDLPRQRRREIVDEITSHLDAARADSSLDDEAHVRTLLDRLGDPDEIAAEARERFGVATPRPSALEPIAIVLVLTGGFFIGLGWLAGVILVWLSDVWTRGQKILATLLFPGGLASAPLVLLVSARSSRSGTSLIGQLLGAALVVAVVVGPIVTAVMLTRRLRQVRARAD